LLQSDGDQAARDVSAAATWFAAPSRRYRRKSSSSNKLQALSMIADRIVQLVSVTIVFLMPTVCGADQPKLGFGGTLVEVKGEFEVFRGYRVDSVRRGTPAAHMQLERGDIVLFIGRSMAFTTHEAYLYAPRQQGRTATIGIINVRNSKLAWDTCRLNHNPEPHRLEDPPNGVIMVDFAPQE
jgi:hypothetical protein